MIALYRGERQADALAAYQAGARAPRRSSGSTRARSSTRSRRAILRQEVAAGARREARHNLPAPVTSFVGREVELAELERLLREQRLVTLTGVGGAGKTRLATRGGQAQVGA